MDGSGESKETWSSQYHFLYQDESVWQIWNGIFCSGSNEWQIWGLSRCSSSVCRIFMTWNLGVIGLKSLSSLGCDRDTGWSLPQYRDSRVFLARNLIKAESPQFSSELMCVNVDKGGVVKSLKSSQGRDTSMSVGGGGGRFIYLKCQMLELGVMCVFQ